MPKKKNGLSTNPVDSTGLVIQEPSKVLLEPSAKKALFKEYESLTKELTSHKKAVDKLLFQRSEIVRQIAEGSEGNTFNRDGVILVAVSRTSKQLGSVTWFFKGPNVTEAEKV